MRKSYILSIERDSRNWLKNIISLFYSPLSRIAYPTEPSHQKRHKRTAKEVRPEKSCDNFLKSCDNFFNSCYNLLKSCNNFFVTEAQRWGS